MLSEKAGCLGILLRMFRGGGESREDLPYEKCEYLLTKAEKSFFLVLVQAVPQDHAVFPKTRLADLIKIRKGVEKWQSHFNRISAKHADFVVCDRQWITPRLVIELDDASHGESRRAERDDFIDAALKAAGLPVLHVKARAAYDARELGKQIAELLAPPQQ